jgi:hypothetical protein
MSELYRHPIISQFQDGKTVGKMWVLFMVTSSTSRYTFSNGDPLGDVSQARPAALQAMQCARLLTSVNLFA